MKSVLSAFSYYGGKAKMAPLICDMLDYSHTTMYIEPFGGGARTLLNKPRHIDEIYNDANAGLCAFMRVIGDPERSGELIDLLYHSEYSPEEFYRALEYCNRYEDNYIDEFARLLSLYLKQLYKKYQIEELLTIQKEVNRKSGRKNESAYLNSINSTLQTFPLNPKEHQTLKNLLSQYVDAHKLFVQEYRVEYDEEIVKNFDKLRYIIVREANKKIREVEKDTSLPDDKRKETLDILETTAERFKTVTYGTMTEDEREIFERVASKRVYEIIHNEFSNNIAQSMEDVDEMKLAYSTYIVYSQSRDGMGKAWSNTKFKSTFDYHGYISNLYDVAARMRGVRVFQEGALSFLLSNNYLNMENVCFYLDPSYLKPEDEKKNLGGVYKFSSDYDVHELLLKTICNAKARILISNYDLPLYNKYLTAARGGRKLEFETKTTVGGAKDNKRTEILWWNY